MKDTTLAVLLTVFNRKEKTLKCLNQLYRAFEQYGSSFKMDIYLTDDGSKDGTSEALRESFPEVKLLQGTGSMFWAGGMRNSWKKAIQNNYDGYLLLNDDTNVFETLFSELEDCQNYSVETFQKEGIYIGSTKDAQSDKLSYGGRKLHDINRPHSSEVFPDTTTPQECHLGNANILYVAKDVVDQIGILDEKFTHGIADFDYTLRAVKAGFPVLICKNYCGTCENDHGKRWLSQTSSLKKRIQYLKSPTGLSYNDFMYFNKVHFPKYAKKAAFKLWLRTLFPILWEFKK